MRVSARFTAVIGAVAIPAAGLAAMAPAAASTTARVRVVGVDRTGHVVSQQATLEAVNGASYQISGKSIRIPTGTYLIGGTVQTGSASETLVVRQVRVSRSETIRLSAAGGKLVRAALTGVTGAPDTTQVSACLGTQTSAEAPVYASGGGASALYTVPFRSRNVGFSYLAYWSRTPAGYAISGSSAGGVASSRSTASGFPASPELTLAVRSGAAPATDDLWFIGPGNSFHALCAPDEIGGDVTAPFRETNFVTPGTWTSRVDTDYENSRGESFDTGLSYLVRRLAARHAYTQNLRFSRGRARAGPVRPSTATSSASPRPTCSTSAVCGAATCAAPAALPPSASGPRKLWTAHLNEWRGHTDVQHVVTRAGWYNFDVSAARWNPHGSEPAGLLSPRAIDPLALLHPPGAARREHHRTSRSPSPRTSPAASR